MILCKTVHSNKELITFGCYPSNTFHQSEKKYLFNALTFCYKNDKLGEIENIKTQQKLLDVMSKYDKSCYFHVDPRREIFASVKKYIC